MYFLVHSLTLSFGRQETHLRDSQYRTCNTKCTSYIFKQWFSPWLSERETSFAVTRALILTTTGKHTRSAQISISPTQNPIAIAKVPHWLWTYDCDIPTRTGILLICIKDDKSLQNESLISRVILLNLLALFHWSSQQALDLH